MFQQPETSILIGVPLQNQDPTDMPHPKAGRLTDAFPLKLPGTDVSISGRYLAG